MGGGAADSMAGVASERKRTRISRRVLWSWPQLGSVRLLLRGLVPACIRSPAQSPRVRSSCSKV